MAAIRSGDTRPEMILRKGLHARGFRFRLHGADLPGKPDIILPKYRALIFVNGCFWHGHGCALFVWPKTRAEFWRLKIEGNVARDRRNEATLSASGWRVARVWECAIRGRQRLTGDAVMDRLSGWICSDTAELDIAGGA